MPEIYRVTYWMRGALRPVLTDLIAARSLSAAKAEAHRRKGACRYDWFELEA